MKDLKTVLLIAVPVLVVAAAFLILANPFAPDEGPSRGSFRPEPTDDRPPIDYEDWPRETPPQGRSDLPKGYRPPPEGGKPDILTLDLLKELLAKGDYMSWQRIRWLFQYGVVEDPAGAQALLVKALETDANAGAWLEQIFPLLKDEAARKLAVEGLLALTRSSGDVQVLKGAIRSLGIVGDGQTALDISGWLQGLSPDEPKYQEKLAAAASAIAAIGAPESAEELAGLLMAQQGTSFEPVVLKAIGRMKSGIGEMVQALAPFLGEDAPAGLKASAARALGYLGAPEAEAPLTELIAGSAGSSVKQEAILALGRVGTRGAVEELIRIMDEDAQLGFAAGMALRNVDREEAVEPMLGKLDEVEDPRYKANMVHALGNTEDERAVPKLRTILESGHENSDVRRESAQALGKIGDPESVSIYADRLSAWEDEDERVILGVLAGARYMTQKRETHAALNEKLVPILREITAKPSTSNVYRHAKQTLNHLESAASMPLNAPTTPTKRLPLPPSMRPREPTKSQKGK